MKEGLSPGALFWCGRRQTIQLTHKGLRLESKTSETGRGGEEVTAPVAESRQVFVFVTPLALWWKLPRVQAPTLVQSSTKPSPPDLRGTAVRRTREVRLMAVDSFVSPVCCPSLLDPGGLIFLPLKCRVVCLFTHGSKPAASSSSRVCVKYVLCLLASTITFHRPWWLAA